MVHMGQDAQVPDVRRVPLQSDDPVQAECRGSSALTWDRQQDQVGQRVHRRACHCDCGKFGCRSTTGDSHRDDRSRGRSPQRRPQDGFGAREWSPSERGTRDTSADFSPRRPGSDVPQGSHSAGERKLPVTGIETQMPVSPLQSQIDYSAGKAPARALDSCSVGYLEPEVRDNVGLVVARTVAPVKNGCTVARLLNPTEKELKLHPGSHLGVFHHDADIGQVLAWLEHGQRPPRWRLKDASR
ncbi:hypothetical protein F7725_027012, partial [Dissostichus mawsoni]